MAGLFVFLYMLDAWLSIQFITYDIDLEANPVIRFFITATGWPEILYLMKAAAIAIAGTVYLAIEKVYYFRALLFLVILVFGMMWVNNSSLKLLVYICDNATPAELQLPEYNLPNICKK
jgi:hypothetical protein